MTATASVGAVGAILLFAALAGWAASRGLFPRQPAYRAERFGWGVLLGLALLAATEAFGIALGFRPGRIVFILAALAAAFAGRFLAFRSKPPAVAGPASSATGDPAGILLVAAAAAGVILFGLRAMTEPMWSNDFLAIWGLKGKAIFASGGLPAWLFDSDLAGFSHPEYPLGLPLVYAGLARVLGRWDDHAMALLFPAIQVATLAVLFGWLARRGASRRIAFAACALLSLFEPLFSGFLTGLAEVPLSAAMLLVGSAMSDALDETDRGALRRLAVAAFLAGSLKNEGIFVAGVAAAAALVAGRGRARSLRVAGAGALGAVAAWGLGRMARGPAALRDFDFGLLVPGRLPELAARLADALRFAAGIAASSWPILLLVAVLFACGRRTASADRLLALAILCAAAYAIIPAFAVRGPEWMAKTTLPRTTAALAPLAAAGIAGRLRGVGRDPAISAPVPHSGGLA
jgi:hypothetical protein